MIFHLIKHAILLHSFLTPSIPKNKETLKLVSVVFRHGDRTPVKPYELYPNDPHKDYNFGETAYSVLTESGKQRAYRLGKFLKNNYKILLDLTHESVIARSTDVNRTKESLKSVLKALYPEFAIDIYSKPLFKDSLLLPQSCYKFLIDSLKLSKDKNVIKDTLELKDIMKNLTDLTGKNITTAMNIHYIYTTLEIEKAFNLTLPSWTNGLFPDGQIVNGSALQFKFLNYNENLKKQTGGMLIRKFINDMLLIKAGLTNKNLFLYSGHDITVASVLYALGVYFPHVPKYSSAVILELHEIAGDYFVKVVYYLGVPEKTIVLTIPNCEKLCPLDKFINLMKNILPSKVSFLCPKVKTSGDDAIYNERLKNIIKLLKILFK
ncbi:venom acid phosphatase Acph-1-like isoform X2 [Leptopilina boulardi]|uniref:venom acid phosphatase Acph-1-like isoform X2 n=1 Tax=Leptopilina boulardi TaxID=63433 RepID=UPI0021F5FB52|nr:venom acid phosphatase Acph-1-like isoform X2 [Leptopilina boulardi]XP_051168232.1 venom acid phosphatase Acph-1-like isoform X2 [Leptopilina boulardi]XP_051168233.1 venom acid phosphatase Acph-1-like isoform X2 [Leptopilina boulardi]